MGSDAHQLGAKSPPDLPSYRLHKTGFRNKPESSTCNSHRFTNLVLSSRHAMPESKSFFLHTECGASSQICLKFNRFVWSVLVGALKPNFGLIPLESESANVPKCAQGHGVPTFRIANVRHVPESCLVEAVRFRKVRHKCPTWTFLAFSPRPITLAPGPSSREPSPFRGNPRAPHAVLGKIVGWRYRYTRADTCYIGKTRLLYVFARRPACPAHPDPCGGRGARRCWLGRGSAPHIRPVTSPQNGPKVPSTRDLAAVVAPGHEWRCQRHPAPPIPAARAPAARRVAEPLPA